MVLPTDPDQTWPPSIWDPVAHSQRLWSAWFSGNADQLSWAYYNLGANSATGRAFFRTTGEANIPQPRPGQYRGGLLGSVDRYFWGQATPPGEKRSKIHVPLAGDISSMSADLLFAKRPRFDTTEFGPGPTADWLDNRFDDDLHATLLEGAELCSALGGLYLRTIFDRDIADRPFLDLVHADAAVPTFKYGKLTSVIFWRVLHEDGDEVHRHLEQHDLQNNAIFHGVYIGTPYQLGEPGNFGDYPEMQPVAASLDADNAITFPDLPPDASTVTYVPNMRPNRIWRDVYDAAALGRSDYAGVEGLMDALDETYSSWIREIRLAKLRLIVPPSYLDNIGPGKGAVFEPDREVFTPLNLLAGSADASAIAFNQFTIRWQEYKTTCDETVNHILRGAGYAPQTFGDAPTTAMTATEIENRERRTLLTRQKKLNYWRPALADALYSLMCLERSEFGRTELEPVRPDIVWPEAVLPSQQELAQTAVALSTAEAASKETLVSFLHPDWTAEQVDVEVQRLRDEASFDILGRARVQLAPPMGSTATIGQEIDEIAGDVKVHTLTAPAVDPNQELQP
jgi:hypothetical protein